MKGRLAIACVVLAALAAATPAAAPAAEAPNHILKEEIGPVLIPPPPIKVVNPLKDPCGLAVDPTGRLFVSNYYEHAIYVFAPKQPDDPWSFETRIEIEEPPLAPNGKPVGGPCDLAIDSAGNLYVNNWHLDVVRFPRLSPGAPSYGPGVVIDSHEPTGVAVDSADHVFVDARTHVAEYEPSGAPVLDGGEPVRIGLGSLGDGYGVAVSAFAGSPGFPATAGLLYVADAADETVKVYDPSGDPSVPVQVIDGGGTPGLGFSRLLDSDLAVDPVDGHVYVVDNLQPFFEEPEAVVHEFSSLGHYRSPVPPGVALGQPSEVIHGEPSAVMVFEHDVYLTSGNYFDDESEPKHSDSRVVVYGPTAEVETGILTVAKTGGGVGTVFSSSPAGLGCGTVCEGEFTLEKTVVLTAVPAPQNRLVGWTGCQPLPDLSPRCSLTMLGNHAVSAEFEPIPQLHLTVNRSGGGAGTVSSAPAGIDCGSVCEADFDEASTLTLRATAAPHSAFAGWTGCDSEPGPGECVVTMSAARAVTASFDAVVDPPPPPPPPPGQRILAVSTAATGAAGGTVVSEPAGIDCGGACARVFGEGETVTLVARPAPGSRLLGWGGCDSATGDRCIVTLGGDRMVVAAFGPGFPGPLRTRKLVARGGAGTLGVLVPGPGTLSATGKGLRPTSALPLAAGEVDLPLRLSAAGRRTLQRSPRGRLAVRVALSFTPFDGGSSVHAARTVTFERRGARR